MKKNNALLLLIPILILMSASCIKYIGTYSYSSQRKLVFPDSTIYFYVVYKKVAADKGPIDVRYYFFKDEKIRTSYGFPEGYPLNGKFLVYSNSSIIIEKGRFNKGLKVGKWYRWDTIGNLCNIFQYKKGRLSGKQYRFIKEKNYKLIETFKNGLLDGKVTEYIADSVIRTDYYDNEKG